MLKIFQALRSVVYLMFMALFTVSHATIILLFFWLPTKYLQYVVSNWCALNLYMLKLICGLSYEIKGMENLDKTTKKNGGVVLMSKHQSTMETMIFQLVLNPKPALVLKKELLNIPFYGWALAQMKPIAINRQEKSSAMQQVITRGAEAIKEGRSVLIFPEGTRTAYGQETKVKKGGVNLALEANAPIIPIAIDTGKYWAKGSLVKNSGKAMISFGPSIAVEGKTALVLQAEVKQWIDSEISQFNKK